MQQSIRRSTRHDVEVEQHAGYIELIRRNVNFRRLWLGNIVSLLGDWFNTIALYTLVFELTGSPFALGAVFISKMLPWALASPIAGLVVDRFDRRHLMIVSDLLRAVVVLGFLLIDDPAHVYLIYVLITLQVVIGSVFQPAKSASVPNITTPAELLTANALSSATWSVMLAAGAALGGFATAWLGVDMVFIIDSATYVVSAWFIYRTVIPQEKATPSEEGLVRSAFRDIAEGWRHIRSEPRIARIATAKATWGIAGGSLVYLLTLLGEEISPGATAMGIGILFAVRGAGTGIGPIVVRAVFLDRATWPAILGLAIAFSGVCYAVVGFMPWTYVVTVMILLAHAASGANWVLATVMLQKRTPDRFRGRVFATEWLLVMGAESLSIFLASSALEAGLIDLRTIFIVMGAVQFLTGLLWFAVVVPRERREEG
ncbi:MAG: MFS transporter [Bacteroidota bacterium]